MPCSLLQAVIADIVLLKMKTWWAVLLCFSPVASLLSVCQRMSLFLKLTVSTNRVHQFITTYSSHLWSCSVVWTPACFSSLSSTCAFSSHQLLKSTSFPFFYPQSYYMWIGDIYAFILMFSVVMGSLFVLSVVTMHLWLSSQSLLKCIFSVIIHAH